jgi:class 3 adenylate cyclase/CHASE2 domain-containing sensor protein
VKAFFHVSVLALLGFSIALGLSSSTAGARLEHGVYDWFMRIRTTQGKAPEVDSRLLIVEIDEQSRQTLTEPLALWLPYFGEFLSAAFTGGARAVGMDVIPSHAPRELLLPFAEAFLSNPDSLVMVEFYDVESDTMVRPAEGIRALVGDPNLALSNLVRDQDGVNRRQVLSDWQINGEGHRFFTRLLYERFEQVDRVPKEEFLINFTGPQGTLPRVSFSDVIAWSHEGRTDQLRSLFEGKLVLLGATSKVDQDFVPTPFSQDNPMPGVEMHGNILNTLLTQAWLETRSAWLGLAVLLMPLAWVSLRKPLAASTIFCLVLCFLWVGGSYLAFLQSTVISPVASAVVGLLSTYLLGYLYRFNTVEREKRRIRSVFGKYVSPDVMEAMLEFPEDHKPERARRQRVTVMFSDINDFSTACETLEPEEVTRRLNAYFGEMTNIIYAHQGTIIRFIGDEFMVLFGAPKTNDKSEEMAVLSAVRMVDRLKRLSAQDPEGTEGFYEVKIGIHVGDMILTSIGNQLRSDYNCIGDSTNMAARVLSLTKPLGATVLISEDVKERVEGHPELEFKDLGVHQVKGRRGEVRVFEAFLKPLSRPISRTSPKSGIPEHR